MINLTKINFQLEMMPEDQAAIVNYWGAQDLGRRAGVVVFAYAFTAISFLGLSVELQDHLLFIGPITVLLVLCSCFRYIAGKQLAIATIENSEKYLSRYGWLSLVNAFLLGLFGAAMIYKLGLTLESMIMINVVAGITGASIGTMSLYLNLWTTFTITAWIPVLIACVHAGILGNNQGYFFTFICSVFLLFIIFIGKRIANEYWRGQVAVSELQVKKHDLEDALNMVEEQRSEVRKHRDNLQDMVEEQTYDLRVSKEAAEKANRAKSEFLANMSHELRTPMHAILSFSNFGIDRVETSSTDKLKEYFAQINESGNRLINLIDDLLDLSKMNAMKMIYNFELNDLTKLVEQNIAEQKIRLAERDITIVMLPTTCQTNAFFDDVRIGQVITNLCSNAMKFSPDGKTITISIKESELRPGRRKTDMATIPALLFTITDEGVGIPEDELYSIFNAFIQSSKTNSGAGGTGLGLAICKEIIESHHGMIWAKNTYSGGAEFNFLLPTAGAFEMPEEYETMLAQPPGKPVMLEVDFVCEEVEKSR